MIRKIIAVVPLILGIMPGLWGQSAEEIVQKMDEMQSFNTLYVEGSMVSTDRFGEKTSTFKSWSRNSEDFLIEFTNVEERGQKVLRVNKGRNDEIYLFYPDAEEIIPLSGAAMKQSMFGDVSYEDISEERKSLETYDVSMKGSELVGSVDCWIIEMVAISRNVPYPKKILKVGKADYILREAEYYARSGRLLKIVEIINFQKFDDGRVILTESKLIDQLRRQSSTRLLLTAVEPNPTLSDELFSLRSLY